MKFTIPFLLLGIAIGYFIPRVTSEKETGLGKNEQSIRLGTRSSGERSVTARPMFEFEDLVGEELAEKVSSLSRDEIRVQIKAVLSGVDPFNGLIDGHDLLEELLSRASIDDFHGTLTWMESCLPKSVQLSLRDKMFETYAEYDFHAAMTYAESLTDEAANNEVLDFLFFESFKYGNSAVEKSFELMRVSEGGSSGGMVSFPDDFDFQSFADLSLQKISALGEDEDFTFYPSNFLSEWAGRDLDGALKFYNEHLILGKNRFPYNDFERLVAGHLKSIPPEQELDWIQEMLDDSSLNEHQRREVMEATLARFSRVEELIDLQKTEESRAALIGEFFKMRSRHGGEKPRRECRKLLLLFPSPTSRIDYIMSNVNSLAGHFATNNLAEDLELLGHSTEEIVGFREAAKAFPK